MIKISSEKLLKEYIDPDILDRYLNEVERANQRFNLFSRNIARPELKRLVAESLIPVWQGWIQENSGPVLDLGSGWGVPAVPILLSGVKIDATLLERSQKKADFLLLLLRQLGLNAEIVANDFREMDISSQYRLITVRGVALDGKISRRLRQVSLPNASLIYFGALIPCEWCIVSQLIEYSVDDSPSRKIVKAVIS